MSIKQVQKPSYDYVKELKTHSDNVEIRGKRRYYNSAAAKMAVAAILDGVPKDEVSSILKISKSTLHKWERRFAKKLSNKKSGQSTDHRVGIPIQTLQVTESSPAIAEQPVQSRFHNEIVEMHFGSVLIKVFGG